MIAPTVPQRGFSFVENRQRRNLKPSTLGEALFFSSGRRWTPLCKHKKGHTYSKQGKKTLCFYTLEDPKDAYEWSFVAIPAQRKAGVTKSFNGRKEEKELEFNEILKQNSVTTYPLIFPRERRDARHAFINLNNSARQEALMEISKALKNFIKD